MALYDHRVFSIGEEWWIAQVHGAVGSGWGEEKIKMTHETVMFTCLTKEDEKTRQVGIEPGDLNWLSHASLVAILAKAQPIGSRMKMHPYNVPDPEELGDPTLKDEDGLRWIIREASSIQVTSRGPEVKPAIEAICLDDSALRRTIGLQDSTTYADLKNTHGMGGDLAIVESIKGLFKVIEADDLADYGE